MDVELLDSLDGQVALVTGATRGIGAEIATQLTDLGATVFAGARRPGDVDDDRLRPVRLDVTDEPQIEAAIEEIVAETSRLDVLVNNAGIYGPPGPIHEDETAAVAATLETDLLGPIVLARHALSLLLELDGGRLVNVSSRAGQFAGEPGGGHPAYAAAKAGLNRFTLSLDATYAARGLLANAACPGWVRTEMGGPEATRSIEEGADTPVWLCRFAPGAPSGRFWAERSEIEW